MRNVKKIRKSELVEMLLNCNFGSQPVSIQYVTEPKINKEGKKLFPNLIKIANIGGMIGYSYQNSVNNQLERESKEKNFVSQTLWNGKGRRVNPYISEHIEKGDKYMTVKYQQSFMSLFLSNNQLIDRSKVKPFLPVKYKNQSQGTDNEVIHLEININNIRKIKMRKTTYILIED